MLTSIRHCRIMFVMIFIETSKFTNLIEELLSDVEYAKDEIWMLTAYEKSKQENIPGHILKKIAEEIKNV